MRSNPKETQVKTLRLLAAITALPALVSAQETEPDPWRSADILSIEQLLERVRPLAVGEIDHARLEAIELRHALAQDACGPGGEKPPLYPSFRGLPPPAGSTWACVAWHQDLLIDLEAWLAQLERKRVNKLEACVVFLLEGRDDEPAIGELLRRDCASHLTQKEP